MLNAARMRAHVPWMRAAASWFSLLPAACIVVARAGACVYVCDRAHHTFPSVVACGRMLALSVRVAGCKCALLCDAACDRTTLPVVLCMHVIVCVDGGIDARAHDARTRCAHTMRVLFADGRASARIMSA